LRKINIKMRDKPKKLNIFFDLDDTLINTTTFIERIITKLVNELIKILKIKELTKEEKEILKEIFKENIENLDSKTLKRVITILIKKIKTFNKNIKNDLERKNNDKSLIKLLCSKLESLYWNELNSLKINESKFSILNDLKRLKDIELYLLTEGNKTWQYKKITLLNLEKIFNSENIFIVKNKNIKTFKKIKENLEIKSKNKYTINLYIMIGDKLDKDIYNSRKANFIPIYYINKSSKHFSNEKIKSNIKVHRIESFEELFRIIELIKISN